MSKGAVLVVAPASLLSVITPSARSVTWHNDGNTSFHATSTATTLSGTGANGLVCPGGTSTGTVSSSPFVGVTWTVMTGTVKWANCQLGGTGWTIDCAFAVTAFSWQAGTPAVTSGTGDVTCGAWLAGVRPCTIAGTLPGHYVNPIAPSTFGRSPITTGGTATLTNGGGGTCPLGTNDRGHLTAMTFTVDAASGGSGTLGPILTRTS